MVHARGPSNINLGIFVYSFVVVGFHNWPVPSINYARPNNFSVIFILLVVVPDIP